MDALKAVLQLREDKSPQAGAMQGDVCLGWTGPFGAMPSPIGHARTLCCWVQVQALLDCLSSAAFQLQVCICSVGE